MLMCSCAVVTCIAAANVTSMNFWSRAFEPSYDTIGRVCGWPWASMIYASTVKSAKLTCPFTHTRSP